MVKSKARSKSVYVVVDKSNESHTRKFQSRQDAIKAFCKSRKRSWDSLSDTGYKVVKG